MFHLQSHWSPETHLLPVRSAWETSAQKLRWKIVWRNASRIWWDFGSALPFQTRLTQTKPVLPLSNEHGSQLKHQCRRQCRHNKHKKFPCRPTRDVSLLSGHASYLQEQWSRDMRRVEHGGDFEQDETYSYSLQTGLEILNASVSHSMECNHFLPQKVNTATFGGTGMTQTFPHWTGFRKMVTTQRFPNYVASVSARCE
jgi:hypothetical protein